ncbi:MAG: hypothetical protein RIB53_04200 [Roseitalea porphyridii]|jgi:hypothetical protein|uniref:hypothetical protein n=1 Tax=Roseitalea porphyridii TaxID=1852022 RepID=UPI0032EDD931
MNQTERQNAFARFSAAELRRKRTELKALIDSGMLTDRSLDNQHAEIAMIENELAFRDDR